MNDIQLTSTEQPPPPPQHTLLLYLDGGGGGLEIFWKEFTTSFFGVISFVYAKYKE